MKYMGSKARIAKHILPIILKDRKEGQCYVEPFVGGANMIDKADGWRIGADFNKDCIDCLKIIRDKIQQLPKCKNDFSEESYKNRCKDIKWLKPYAAFAFSFGGKYWGGFRRDKSGARDYIAEAYSNSYKQSQNIQGVELINSNYLDLKIPSESIIYCDPPYANTTKYKDDFNHDTFWQWCRDKTKEGHKVFISEYNAPYDFECIWQQELNVSVAKNGKHKKAIEKLFVYMGN
jgi:DNA adenine methylase